MPGFVPSIRTRRFHPPGLTVGGSVHSTAQYRCPRCRTCVPVFQLRNDVHDVPRLVNVKGCMCLECVQATAPAESDD